MTLLEHPPETGLPIIETYPALRGLRLHSLAHAHAYRCEACEQQRESTMLATRDGHEPTCPRCYADQVRDVVFPAS